MTSSLLAEKHDLDHQSMIDEVLWKRLVGRIIKDESIQRGLAERIMNEALRFLALCAARPDGRFSPSPLVDIGWHTFILHTQDYATFCDRVAGRFIHHVPNDTDQADPDALPRTVAALTAHGGALDDALWVPSANHGSACGSDGDDEVGSVSCGSGCGSEGDDSAGN